MTRRTLIGALLVGAMLAPARTQAQVLRTWCTSPTGDACFNALSLDYVVTATTFNFNGVSTQALDVRRRLTGYWSGSTVMSYSMMLWDYWAALPAGILGGAYRLGDWFGAPGAVGTAEHQFIVDAGATITPLSIDDIEWIGYSTPGADGRCSPAQGTCVSVPEPGAWLLMASGLLGLAWVGRRSWQVERGA